MADDDTTPDEAFSRFVALVQREFDADEVSIDEPQAAPLESDRVPHAPSEHTVVDGENPPASTPPEGAPILTSTLRDGRVVTVRLKSGAQAEESARRRLEMLVDSFAEALRREPASARKLSRPPIGRSLQDELRALAARAGAVDAIVIDSDSPVVWGAAVAVDQKSGESLHVPPDERESPSHEVLAVTRRAAAAVRSLPGATGLHKGRHLRHVERTDEFGYCAHSFAGIYLTIVVFSAPFDELRAERAMNDALPRIEKLVLALPPLDPEPAPEAGVMAMRGRRSRR